MKITIDNAGFSYYVLPPKGFILMTSPSEFFTLIQGKRKWCKENIELVVGAELLIFSPYSGRCYLRRVTEYHNPYSLDYLMTSLRQNKLHIKYLPEHTARIKWQFNSCDLTYNSMVMVNEFMYELEVIGNKNMEDGIKSRRRAVEQLLIQFSNNKRNGKNIR
jgi:hypothetical protein